MKPRLITSKKWTHFPKEYVHQIKQVFNEAFSEQLKGGNLVIEGRIYPEEILLRVGFLEKGRLQQNNFEISMDYSQEKKEAIDRIHDCIDATASMMNEFFISEGAVEFPLVWKDYDFNGKRIWVQHSTINSNLEAEADRLLGITDEHLVKEETETEDTFERAEPTMFSGSKKKKKEDLH